MPETTTSYWVKVGNGEKIQFNGVCRGVEIKLQGFGFVADFYVFCLNGDNVVLGMEWLKSLGDIKANFKDLKLRIKRDGVKYNLLGDPGLLKGEMKTNSLF